MSELNKARQAYAEKRGWNKTPTKAELFRQELKKAWKQIDDDMLQEYRETQGLVQS